MEHDDDGGATTTTTTTTTAADGEARRVVDLDRRLKAALELARDERSLSDAQEQLFRELLDEATRCTACPICAQPVPSGDAVRGAMKRNLETRLAHSAAERAHAAKCASGATSATTMR